MVSEISVAKQLKTSKTSPTIESSLVPIKKVVLWRWIKTISTFKKISLNSLNNFFFRYQPRYTLQRTFLERWKLILEKENSYSYGRKTVIHIELEEFQSRLNFFNSTQQQSSSRSSEKGINRIYKQKSEDTRIYELSRKVFWICDE